MATRRPKAFLEAQIKLANEVYSKTGEGLIERVYNTYCQELAEYDPNHPLLQGIETVEVKSNQKVKHETPMLSLAKVYTIEQLREWMRKISRPNENFLLMPKYDGIAGRLDSLGVLATRGDGEMGENISHRKSSLKYICNTKQGNNVVMAYDGEIVITYSDFKKYFESGQYLKRDGEKYKTTRNAVAGMMNSEDKIVGEILTFVDYNYLAVQVTIDTLEFAIKALTEQVKDFPTDGFVVKIADAGYAETLGHTSHHWKHSMALKHDNETTTTKLVGVEFQMAKDHIGIVGKLDPVEINGVTIKRVSLHNLDVIKELGLEIGDEVLIERAGDVIPHIKAVVKKGPGYKIECTHCPSCRMPVYVDGQFYRCPNDLCEDKIVNKINSALKDLGSKGISTETIRFIVQNAQVLNIVDFLKVNIVSTLRGQDGYGERKINNIWSEIMRLKIEPMAGDQILAALNIPGFGRSLFKKLLNVKSTSFEDFTKHSVGGYAAFPNMSEKRGEMLYDGFQKEGHVLSELLNIFTLKTNEGSVEMEKGSVCFTGTGSKGRAEYAAMAAKGSYEVKSSVTAGLDVLVCADPSSESNKMKKARANGTSVISYDDFETMVGGV